MENRKLENKAYATWMWKGLQTMQEGRAVSFELEHDKTNTSKDSDQPWHPQSDPSSVSIWWIFKSLAIHKAHSKDPDNLADKLADRSNWANALADPSL